MFFFIQMEEETMLVKSLPLSLCGMSMTAPMQRLTGYQAPSAKINLAIDFCQMKHCCLGHYPIKF